MSPALNKRADDALASGAAVVAPVDPRPIAASSTPHALGGLDDLAGRPFFQAVEMLAATHAQDGADADRADAHRPHAGRSQAGPTTWTRGLAARDPGLDAVAADAHALRAEIVAQLPHASVQLVSAEDLLETYLRADENALTHKLFLAAGPHHPDADPRALFEVSSQLALESNALQFTGARALCDEVPARGGGSAGTFHVVVDQPSAVDPSVDVSLELNAHLARHVESGPTAGYRQLLAPGAERRYANDHEFGHVIDFATGSRTTSDSDPYDVYLAECRADAFAVAMAARRGDDAGLLAQHLENERNLAAVASEDTLHWTTPVVRAMDARSRALGGEALRAMPLADLMSECRSVTAAHALDQESFEVFDHTLTCLVEGETPLSDARDPGAIAARSAFTGYAAARIAGASGGPERLSNPDRTDEKAAAARDPRAGALAELGHAMAEIDLHAGALEDVLARPALARDRQAPRALSRSLDGLMAGCDRLLVQDERYARALDGPDAPRRDYVGARTALDRARGEAHALARVEEPRRALDTTQRVLTRAGQAMAAGSPYTAAAQRSLAILADQARQHTPARHATPVER